MKRIIASLAMASALLCSQAKADGTINTLTAGSALVGTELIPIFQSANPAVTTTPAALSTYLQTLGVYVTLTGTQTLSNKTFVAPALGTPASGVATNLTGTAAGLTAGHVTTNANLTGDVTSVGNTTTLATVNANVGSFGSATTCTAFTTNAKGLITAASAVTCTPAIASITGLGTGVGTALAIAPGTTGSFTTQDGAITTGHCLQWGPGVQDAGAACGGSGGSGTVTSVGAGCGTSTGGSAITTSGNVTAAYGGRVNATTSDTLVSGDCGSVVYETSSSNVAITIAQAGTTGFGANTFFQVCDTAGGTTTITPTTSTIGGAATLVIQPGSTAHPSCASFRSDGTNYTLLDVVPGAGVPAAIGTGLSVAGGVTGTIASGTATLGTAAIASGACATVVTVTATNVATTDVVSFSYNSDPTTVTGYGASATGAVLTIYPYPTSGNVNVKVCNSTGSSITPGSMTLNWRVWR